MKTTLGLLVAVACLSAVAVYQVAVLEYHTSEAELSPLLPGDPVPFTIPSLGDDNHNRGCISAFLVDPECPVSRSLAKQGAGWALDEHAHHYWIVSGNRRDALSFRDDHLLPANQTLFLDAMSSRGSWLAAIGVFASPTRIVIGHDGIVRAIGIATQPYTKDELSVLCGS